VGRRGVSIVPFLARLFIVFHERRSRRRGPARRSGGSFARAGALGPDIRPLGCRPTRSFHGRECEPPRPCEHGDEKQNQGRDRSSTSAHDRTRRWDSNQAIPRAGPAIDSTELSYYANSLPLCTGKSPAPRFRGLRAGGIASAGVTLDHRAFDSPAPAAASAQWRTRLCCLGLRFALVFCPPRAIGFGKTRRDVVRAGESASSCPMEETVPGISRKSRGLSRNR
jgi:hypothetical protein